MTFVSRFTKDNIAQKRHCVKYTLCKDEKNTGILLLLDLSAAFDMVDRDILLFHPNSQFGIQGSCIEYINVNVNSLLKMEMPIINSGTGSEILFILFY